MIPRFPIALSLLLWSSMQAATPRKIDLVGIPSDYAFERDTLVYMRQRSGTVELAASTVTGTPWTVPTQAASGTYHYDFDYSTGRLWFQALSATASWRLVCQKLDGSDRTTVGSSSKYRESVRAGGQRAVWVDYRHVDTRATGNSEIYTTTYPGLIEERITTDTLFQSKARTNGVHIAWMEYDPTRTRANIVVLDTRTGVRRVASPQTRHQDHPTLSASHLAWTDYRNHPTEGDIFRMDLATGTVEPVHVAAGHQEKPATDGSMVYWMDFRTNGTAAVRGKDMATQQVQEIGSSAVHASVPRASAGRVAWFEADTLVVSDDLATNTIRAPRKSAFAQVRPGENAIRLAFPHPLGRGERLLWIGLDGARTAARWAEIGEGVMSVEIPNESHWRFLVVADGSRWTLLASRSLAR